MRSEAGIADGNRLRRQESRLNAEALTRLQASGSAVRAQQMYCSIHTAGGQVRLIPPVVLALATKRVKYRYKSTAFSV